uniref:Uncharacterized protein n=1 Tax=Meloidogyne javanica TaxID=6303 RepID=A0A915M2U1_MELJA
MCVTPLSVFVKVSWRDNGENGLDYHRHLAERQAGRFDLQLTSNTSAITIIAETNAYDTYHFLQAENEDEGLTNNYKLRIFNDDLSKKNVMIRCKEDESNFVVILDKIRNAEQNEEYKSQYVRSKVCPNDEYLLLIFEDVIQEEVKCQPAIYSSLELNFYEIVFNDQTKKFVCKLIENEHRDIQNYFNMIDNAQAYIENNMGQYFVEQNAIEVVEDTQQQPHHSSLPMQPYLGLTPGTRSPQRGQKQKGKGTKESNLPKSKKAKPPQKTFIHQQHTLPQQRTSIPQPHVEIPQQHFPIPQQYSDITHEPPAIPQQHPAIPKQQHSIPQQPTDIPQQPILISFDHQKGQNELRQRMVQFIRQIPQKFQQSSIQYMEELLTYLPNPQTQPPTQTTLEGLQSVLAGPPLTEQSRLTLNFLHGVNKAEFQEQNDFGPAEQEYYRNSRLPQQYHLFFPQNVRPQTGIRFQERSQGQHPQQHLASHQQHFQQQGMMVQPHLPIGAFVPNPSALDRGKLPAIQETTEVESSDSDQPLNPEAIQSDYVPDEDIERLLRADRMGLLGKILSLFLN